MSKSVLIKVLVGCLLIWWGLACCGYTAAGSAPADQDSTDTDLIGLSGKPVSGLDINIIGPEKDKNRWVRMATTLIDLSVGEIFSPDRFQQSLPKKL